MTYPNIFTQDVSEEVIRRIETLTPATRPLWGKMNAAQMLAHCAVAYEMVYEKGHKKPNALMQIVLKAFVKETVTGPKPYKKNSPTAAAFKITSPKDFKLEKSRLILYLKRTSDLGIESFDGKESNSFGKLSADEWNTMFYKHLDHHLRQFGV